MAEERLVAGWTVGVAVSDDVATAGQCLVTAEAGEVPDVPLTVHPRRRLARKY